MSAMNTANTMMTEHKERTEYVLFSTMSTLSTLSTAKKKPSHTKVFSQGVLRSTDEPVQLRVLTGPSSANPPTEHPQRTPLDRLCWTMRILTSATLRIVSCATCKSFSAYGPRKILNSTTGINISSTTGININPASQSVHVVNDTGGFKIAA